MRTTESGEMAFTAVGIPSCTIRLCSAKKLSSYSSMARMLDESLLS